jgi:hypothetical protein
VGFEIYSFTERIDSYIDNKYFVFVSIIDGDQNAEKGGPPWTPSGLDWLQK